MRGARAIPVRPPRSPPATGRRRPCTPENHVTTNRVSVVPLFLRLSLVDRVADGNSTVRPSPPAIPHPCHSGAASLSIRPDGSVLETGRTGDSCGQQTRDRVPTPRCRSSRAPPAQSDPRSQAWHLSNTNIDTRNGVAGSRRPARCARHTGPPSQTGRRKQWAEYSYWCDQCPSMRSCLRQNQRWVRIGPRILPVCGPNQGLCARLSAKSTVRPIGPHILRTGPGVQCCRHERRLHRR